MKQTDLKNIFSDYKNKKNKIFKNKEILTGRFLPTTILHRRNQINQLGKIVAPAINNEKISNNFIFGTVGTGKTLVTKHVTSELVKENNKIKILYVNCKMKRVSDTEYRLVAELVRGLGGDVPVTGLPTDQVYTLFFNLLEETGQNVIMILDEIDNIIKKIGDDVLYSFLRGDLKKSTLSIIGISNDVQFTENLDPRVKSSLSEEEIVFPPYNATQLQDILLGRAETAFCDSVLDRGVVAKASALAAQEHGDARKALDLLRIAGEVVERSGGTKIRLHHVDLAEKKLDTDTIIEIVKNQPKQSLMVLAVILKLTENGVGGIQTGDVYGLYEKMASTRGLRLLTQRRVSDLINELDMMGIINTTIVSRGRYGRTREIRLLLDETLVGKVRKILEESYLLDTLNRFS